MSPAESAALRFWSRQVGRDPIVATQLEALVPWIFGCEGIAEELAPSLLTEARGPLELSDTDVRLLARALNAFTEWEPGDPTAVPERQAAADRISELVRVADIARGGAGNLASYVDSVNSFDPQVFVPWAVTESESLVVALAAAARECPYFDSFRVVAPNGHKFTLALRSDDA